MSASASGSPLRIGLVGCGNISTQYLQTLSRCADARVTAVSDRDAARAEAVAQQWGLQARSVEQLLAAEDVDLVLNLTVPAAHAEVSLAAVAAGKHVWTEKPLTVDVESGRRVVEAGEAAGVRVGCAPDTVLGTGIQTARRAVDDGLVGTPTGASATMVTPGHEAWHPDPDFYYLPGGGPLLDMGPYYVSALVTLLGPVTRVLGAGSRSRDVRVVASGPRQGQEFAVEVDTHVTGVLVHASGALSTLLMSFDATSTTAAPIELHGTSGTLSVPDPNRFDGEVRLRTSRTGDWEELPVSGGYRDAARGYGLLDLAATPDGQRPRADGRLGLHVLDVMSSLLTAASRGQAVDVTESAGRPDSVPLGELAQR